jgi:hypothetical protein
MKTITTPTTAHWIDARVADMIRSMTRRIPPTALIEDVTHSGYIIASS